MKTFSEDSSFPMGRLIAGIVAVSLLIGVGLFWLSGQESEKKADALYHQAQDAFKANNLETAKSDIDSALKLEEKPQYLKTKLDVLIGQNKLYEAEEVVTRLISLTPADPNAHSTAAVLAYNQGKLEQSEAYYKAAIRLEPDNADYHVRLANLLGMQGKLDESKAQFESIIRKDPRYKFGWEQYVTMLTASPSPEAAVLVAKRALTHFQDDSDLYFLMASAYDAAHRKAEAVAAYEKSLQLQPLAESIAAKRIFELTGKRVSPNLERVDLQKIPVETEGNLLFAQATVNGVTGRFLLDTGASVSVVFRSKASHYHVKASPLKMEVETGGGIVQAALGLAGIRLGRHEVPQLNVALLADLPRLHADGIIGMDFLGKFKMEVDRENRTISLSR